MNGLDHQTARRRENEQRAAGIPPADSQGLVEFRCECASSDCERSVKVPLYVFRRILASKNQSLLQRGHHASSYYRTIVSIGLTSIEERV